MRDPKRIGKLLRELENLWVTYAPDMRFGQVFAFLSSQVAFDPFFVEDTEWLQIIKDVEAANAKYQEENKYGTWEAQ